MILKLMIDDEIIEAFANHYAYEEKIMHPIKGMIKNPDSKEVFAKKKIMEHIQEIYDMYQTQQQIKAARRQIKRTYRRIVNEINNTAIKDVIK